MTEDKPSLRDQNRLLEDICDRVQSIDRNVEEILDRLGDHFDDVRHQQDWHGYDHANNDDYS